MIALCLWSSVVNDLHVGLATKNRRCRHGIATTSLREIRQYDQIQARLSDPFGSGGRCNHPPDAPHAKGEWIGAEFSSQTPLLAQYAMSTTYEQDRVLDADVEE